MKIKSPFKPKNSKNIDYNQTQKKNIISIIEDGEIKIRQIHKRILKNEVKLESIESHSDNEYKDLLREANEAEKDHEKDLKNFIDLLTKYKIILR